MGTAVDGTPALDTRRTFLSTTSMANAQSKFANAYERGSRQQKVRTANQTTTCVSTAKPMTGIIDDSNEDRSQMPIMMWNVNDVRVGYD